MNLDLLEKTLKIEVIDDDPVAIKIIKKRLGDIEGARIIIRNSPIELFHDLHNERPLIVVLDWYYNTSEKVRYNCTMVLPRLRNYKGLICIFSSESSDVIKKSIIDHLGEMPDNFQVFSKSDFRGMQNEIIDYIADNY